jgi:hypothetical protein
MKIPTDMSLVEWLIVVVVGLALMLTVGCFTALMVLV